MSGSRFAGRAGLVAAAMRTSRYANIWRAGKLALLLPACAGTPDVGALDAGESAGRRHARTTAAQEAVDARAQVGGVELACAAGDEQVVLGGGGVQVVEIWATWCQPCVKALPLWAELAQTEGVDLLAVSIDDDRKAPLRFVEKHGIDLPILWDPFGQELAKAVPLGGVVPTTLVVDCAGAVRHVHEGFGSSQVVDDVAAQVRALREEEACVEKARPTRCTQ